jgi:hypothetical protein
MKIATLALIFGLASVSAANAVVYDFDFKSVSYEVKGQFTTSKTLDSLGGYNITGITGYVNGLNGGKITGLEVNPNQPFTSTTQNGKWFYDNVYFKNTVFLDNPGVAFYAKGYEYNLYSLGRDFYLSTNNPAGSYNAGSLGVATSGVPEMSTWVMMLFGFGSLGFFGARRQAAAA